jgi:hypothetical protein
MSLRDTTADSPALVSREERWYGLPGEEVADRLGVDPAVGISAERRRAIGGVVWQQRRGRPDGE